MREREKGRANAARAYIRSGDDKNSTTKHCFLSKSQRYKTNKNRKSILTVQKADASKYTSIYLYVQ